MKKSYLNEKDQDKLYKIYEKKGSVEFIKALQSMLDKKGFYEKYI